MSTSSLPPLVRRHAERSTGGAVPRLATIAQQGEMWLRPGARGLRFTATQRFAVDRVAFAWRARFPLGPLSLHVADEYGDGEGELAVRLLGIPVQRERSPETTAGEALRYLAELPWNPYALLHNRELEWRELDERRVEVATRVAGRALAVELTADEAGDLVVASSRVRRRKVGGAWVATPWGGSFGDYRSIGDVRVPTVGEAHWELPDGRYVYFRASVTGVELEA